MLSSIKSISYRELKKENPDFDTLLWDMDGTIMETEHLHILATRNILISEGTSQLIEDEKINIICTGNTDSQIYDELILNGLINISLNQFIEKKNKELINILGKTNKQSIISENVQSLIKQNYEMGIKQAVVTSSERVITDVLLDFLDLKRYFNLIVTREDTQENKPSPMPYNHAVNKLNSSREKCIIFEDSIVGMQAAIASGIKAYKADWYPPL